MDFSCKQINQSVTKRKGTVRGLHLLRGIHSETKAVTVISGKILDCIINLNPDSREYLAVSTYELSPGAILLVPPLFAHGFQSLEDNSVVCYAVDKPYVRHADYGVSPFSPTIMQLWPLSVSMVSERDFNLPNVSEKLDFRKCESC